MAREEAEVAAGGRACSLTTVQWVTTNVPSMSKNTAFTKVILLLHLGSL